MLSLIMNCFSLNNPETGFLFGSCHFGLAFFKERERDRKQFLHLVP